MSEPTVDVAGNWRRVRDRAMAAAQRAGRDPGTVRVIAVSKTKPAALVESAIRAGARDIGENYVQEAATKIASVTSQATWHFIGHLQRNKARRAVELFDVIHTVDRAALATDLDRHACELGRRVHILLEVNIGGEATKNGVAPDGVAALLDAMASCAALEVDGLMAIPPAASSLREVRSHFRMLRELRDRLLPSAPSNAPLAELSMGMTDDFEVAIEEGATMVRVGRAIFGRR